MSNFGIGKWTILSFSNVIKLCCIKTCDKAETNDYLYRFFFNFSHVFIFMPAKFISSEKNLKLHY